MRHLPATVVSNTLTGPLDWPDATLANGDAVVVVARLRQESDVPLRSHGSLAMNRSLMAAGLVDYVQVTLFPVIAGASGLDPIFQGAADFDLDLIETRTLDGSIQEPSTARPGTPESTRSALQAAKQPGHDQIRECTLGAHLTFRVPRGATETLRDTSGCRRPGNFGVVHFGFRAAGGSPRNWWAFGRSQAAAGTVEVSRWPRRRVPR
ncbi:hypothetical protein FOH10_02685 [Nocardia otitidiscaviarum]|uniref:Bacterial bifunctional deaminase-reductase C-terminal domain-containing protein n=1 Tax=Nocardia otitidiscaviarum TaxID=1823 RepID=A0A516NFX9_9NOCA|nr:hypothetical protein FOH10_02685 [Nocardia otitidiscaviarum]